MRKRNRVSWFMIIVFMMTIFGGGFGAGISKAEAATQPTDINGHWAQSQIEKAIAQGIVSGYPDGAFKPDQSISRAEFITMVNQAFGFKQEASTNFTDVKSTDWYAEQISRAKAAGYISGYEDGSFKPDNYISRQEVAVSPVSIGQYHRIISSILQSAVEWHIIPINVARRVQPPRAEQTEMNIYDEEQTIVMLAALDNVPIKYRALITLAVLAGLRRGECLGLDWDDIDFEKQEICIKRQSQYLPEKGVFTDTPKTASSIRVVSVPSSLIDTLRTLKVEQNQIRLKLGSLWNYSGRVFTTWDGKPMHPDSISSWFTEFQRTVGLPHIRFHDLRHISATLMLAAGVDTKAVSKRLGHQQTSTTMNIYAHALQSADRGASDKMQELLDRSATTKKQNMTL